MGLEGMILKAFVDIGIKTLMKAIITKTTYLVSD